MNAEPNASGFDTAGAFAQLGNETRVAILAALAGRNDDPTSFAELRERAGVDDSGRFNYHLGKLVGRFVEKTDAGYRLTFAGSRVVGAVYEGTYAEGDAIDPVTLDADCPDCATALELRYADERVTVACPDCDGVVSGFGFPPGGLAGRDPEVLPDLVVAHTSTLVARLRAGLCANCSGPVAPTFEPDADGVTVRFVCDRCRERATTSLPSVLLTDPAVAAFHYDHGIDVRETLPWALSWVEGSEAEQVGESPPRYAVTGTLDDEQLRVVVDRELRVLETTRTSA